MLALVACGREPLPVLGTVPDFSLVDQHGATVTAADLAGRVWVADFVFTRCPDVCPVITATMKRLEQDLAASDADVALVSFSVDPVHDTPDELLAYAGRYGAGPRWRFLTGPRDEVVTLVRNGFKLGIADDGPPSAPITHSDRFVLVDRDRQIRGYYRSREPEDMQRLGADARRLADESA